MRPLGNQEARVRMTQIMQPHMLRNAGLPQGPRETAVRQVVRIEWLSVAATEDQGPMPVLGEALDTRVSVDGMSMAYDIGSPAQHAPPLREHTAHR